MKIACTQLTGAALSWAVAAAEGEECSIRGDDCYAMWSGHSRNLARSGELSLPLIERHIETLTKRNGLWQAEARDPRRNFIVEGRGPSMVLACLRAIAIAYHGYEVDVPDDIAIASLQPDAGKSARH